MASINNKDGKAKRTIKHRDDADWFTIEICDRYRKKAIPIISKLGECSEAFIQLMHELAYTCDITNLMAMNILRGYYAHNYVANEQYKRKLMENPVEYNVKEERKEFEEWKQQKNELEEMLRFQRQEKNDWIIEED